MAGARSSRLFAVACAIVVPGVCVAAGSIASLGEGNAFPLSVSASGSVVAGIWSPEPDRLEAFRWTRAGGSLGLGNLGDGHPVNGIVSEASGVSGDGSVVVGWSVDDSGVEAYRWTPLGGMTGLGQLDEDFVHSRAYAASSDGSVIVGVAATASGEEAFRWTSPGGMVGLGDLGSAFEFRSHASGVSADGSVVTGFAGSATSGAEAFRWTASQGMVGIGDLPGGAIVSYGQGISADGSTIVGDSQSASGTEAFRWTESEGMIGLGDLEGGGFSSRALAVSGDGSIVVGFGTSESAGPEAFIWTRSGGMQTLEAHLIASEIDLQGWRLTMANGISADGRTIVGYGAGPDDLPGGWIVALPEPSCALPIGACLLAIVERGRMRARVRSAIGMTIRARLRASL